MHNDIRIFITQPRAQMSTQDKAAIVMQQRVEEHQNGEHPYGFMRRDCPLCRYSK